MKKILLVVLALILVVCTQVAAKPQVNTRYAVIIGTTDNVDAPAVTRLVSQIFRKEGIKNINVLLGDEATLNNIHNAIQSIPDNATESILFMICHGTPQYVVVTDGRLYYSELISSLSHWAAPKQLIIIDSCGTQDLSILSAPDRIVVSCGYDYIEKQYTWWVRLFFLYGIKQGKADYNNDGQVSIQEAQEYARDGKFIIDNYGEYFL